MRSLDLRNVDHSAMPEVERQYQETSVIIIVKLFKYDKNLVKVNKLHFWTFSHDWHNLRKLTLYSSRDLSMFFSPG